MNNLEHRLQFVFNHLVARHVVLKRYNDSPFFFDKEKNSLTLQLKTNILVMSDFNVLNNFCSAFGLVYSVFDCPSIDDNNLTIIIEDSKH